jgi:hypothetical protein
LARAWTVSGTPFFAALIRAQASGLRFLPSMDVDIFRRVSSLWRRPVDAAASFARVSGRNPGALPPGDRFKPRIIVSRRDTHSTSSAFASSSDAQVARTDVANASGPYFRIAA